MKEEEELREAPVCATEAVGQAHSGLFYQTYASTSVRRADASTRS